jgi:stage V sporulation protein S
MAQADILKVGSSTNPKKLAGAIAHTLAENKNKANVGRAIMQAVGAAAVNQAIKGFAIAREFVAPTGQDIICVPGFQDIEIEGEQKTAIRFIIEPYDRRATTTEVNIDDILKVSGGSSSGDYSHKMAGAVAHSLEESNDNKTVMQAVGAAAVNNAVKAICIARGFKASQGRDVIFVPGFTDVDIDGQQKTAMKFFVEYR